MPPFKLDPTTLLLFTAVLAFLMSALCASAIKAMPERRRALNAWGAAMALVGGAYLGFGLRPWVPAWFGFLAANLLLIAASRLVLHASQLALQDPHRRWRLGRVAGVGSLAALLGYALPLPRELPVVGISMAVACLLGHTGLILWRGRLRFQSPALVFAALMASLTAVLFVQRSLVAVGGALDQVLPAAESITQLGTLVCAAGFVIAGSLAFIGVVHEQQGRERSERLRRDSLTGLLTPEAFAARATPWMRHPQGAALLLLDLDHLQRVNAEHGHRAGDRVLVQAVRRLVANLRSDDFAARWGDDELAVFLPGASRERVEDLAERLVRDARVQRVQLEGGTGLAYTVSVGMAVAQPGENFATVLARAESALFQAKHEGRDRALHDTGLGWAGAGWWGTGKAG